MSINLPPQNDSLLLVLPVPFRIQGGRIFVEAQAANGLDRWADNFAHVTVAASVIPEADLHRLAGFVWRDLESLEHHQRITAQQLPWAYTPAAFLRAYPPTRKLLANLIARSQYLQFAIGGLLGDWAAIAALEAISQQRRYAIHTDRVEHLLIRTVSADAPLKQRLRVAFEAPLMLRYHRHLIRHCTLGLWHGDDCLRAYASWCPENHLIHDIHTHEADLIDDADLQRKLEDVRINPVLHLVYAGRLDPMKSPLHWLRAIATARDLGARLTVTWYGEGPLMKQARSKAASLGFDPKTTFPGFIADRYQLLRHLRAAHALIFTHITPESPRILLEALVSGTPILGYDCGYAHDLIATHGGGQSVGLQDTNTLGHLVAALAGDRKRLAALTLEAARNGRRFTDATVFAERSQLQKTFA